VKARNISSEERTDRGADTSRAAEVHVTAPVLLLGKTIRLVPTEDGALRAADIDQPTDHTSVERYLAKAFGDRLTEVRSAIEQLARTLSPQELNRVGFKLYERLVEWSDGKKLGARQFRPARPLPSDDGDSNGFILRRYQSGDN